MTVHIKQAAVAIVSNPLQSGASGYLHPIDSHLPHRRREESVLVVWNTKYRGWCLPGGKVNAGETPAAAMDRELEEETGLVAVESKHVYSAPGTVVKDGTWVHVYAVLEHTGEPTTKEAERGHTVKWGTWQDLIAADNPFRTFYERMLVSPAFVRARQLR